MPRTTILAAALLLVALPLRAAQLFDDQRAALKDFLTLRNTWHEWVTTVEPHVLDASYRDGKDIEFWTEAFEKDLEKLNNAVSKFKGEPSLYRSFEVVAAFRETDKTFDNLWRALICRSCSDASTRHLDKWFKECRRHQIALEAVMGNFEGAFSMTLIKADAQLRGNNER